MYLYKIEKRYSHLTGKEILPEITRTPNIICDYTGELIMDGEQDSPLYALKVDYDSGSEEIYYYDDDKEYFKKLNIDYDSIFRLQSHFKMGDDGEDESVSLVKEWITNMEEDVGIFKNCATIEEAMRIARVRTIKRLLNDKTYTPEQLGLDTYE